MSQTSNYPNELLSGIMPENPHYGYLIAAAVLLFWLIGVICGWKWTYSRPGSYRVISCWIYWARKPIVWYLEYSLL